MSKMKKEVLLTCLSLLAVGLVVLLFSASQTKPQNIERHKANLNIHIFDSNFEKQNCTEKSGPFSDLAQDSLSAVGGGLVTNDDGTPVDILDSSGKLLVQSTISGTDNASIDPVEDGYTLKDNECLFWVNFSGDSQLPLNQESYFVKIGKRALIEISKAQWSKSSDQYNDWQYDITLNSTDSNGGYKPGNSTGSQILHPQWYPSNYTFDGSSDVAWTWDNSVISGCSYGSCEGMRLILNPNGNSCTNGFYVEVNELDSTGANIGFSNAVTGSIVPGGKADLTFHLAAGTANVSFGKIRCQN
jgi:hypothetical protein